MQRCLLLLALLLAACGSSSEGFSRTSQAAPGFTTLASSELPFPGGQLAARETTTEDGRTVVTLENGEWTADLVDRWRTGTPFRDLTLHHAGGGETMLAGKTPREVQLRGNRCRLAFDTPPLRARTDTGLEHFLTSAPQPTPSPALFAVAAVGQSSVGSTLIDAPDYQLTYSGSGAELLVDLTPSQIIQLQQLAATPSPQALLLYLGDTGFLATASGWTVQQTLLGARSGAALKLADEQLFDATTPAGFSFSGQVGLAVPGGDLILDAFLGPAGLQRQVEIPSVNFGHYEVRAGGYAYPSGGVLGLAITGEPVVPGVTSPTTSSPTNVLPLISLGATSPGGVLPLRLGNLTAPLVFTLNVTPVASSSPPAANRQQ